MTAAAAGADFQITDPRAGLVRERIELDPLAFSSANQIRTPGLHLTEVVKDMQLAAGHQKAVLYATKPKFDKEQLRDFQLQGFLWEDCMTETLQNRVRATNGSAIGLQDYVRIGEIAVKMDASEAFFIDRGAQNELLTPVPAGWVIMSPDGMRLLADGLARLLELKWTTMSCNMHPESDKTEWFWQVKSYLLGLSVALGQLVDTVEWHVQFPCGNYRGSGVIYERWLRIFSRQQIWDAWLILMQHVRDVVKANPQHPWSQWV